MPDTWNYFKVSISANGGSEVEFASRIEDIDINEGDRPGRSIPGCDGSCLWLDEPQETGEITLRNLKPISINTSVGSGGLTQQYITTRTNWDTTEATSGLQTPVTAATGLIREDFRVSILMTDDTANTSGSGSVTSGKMGLRFYAIRCRIVSHTATGGSGKAWSETYTLKFPPVTAAAIRNYRWESVTSTSALAALSAYAGADLS